MEISENFKKEKEFFWLCLPQKFASICLSRIELQIRLNRFALSFFNIDEYILIIILEKINIFLQMTKKLSSLQVYNARIGFKWNKNAVKYQKYRMNKFKISN